jgi:hypothetical protein
MLPELSKINNTLEAALFCWRNKGVSQEPCAWVDPVHSGTAMKIAMRRDGNSCFRCVPIIAVTSF